MATRNTRNTRNTKKIVEMIEVETKLTDEEKILGKSTEKTKEFVINYESPDILYKVSNLVLNNNPMYVTGQFIESFIGNSNIEARKQLKKGEKEVVTKDADGHEAYKIEVIE